MTKRNLYEEFIDRIDQYVSSGHFFEASWYVYAVLEDRMISMLQNSGGATQSNGQPIRMLGPKLTTLQNRTTSDSLLAANFPYTKLVSWKDRRNSLMHAMAEGTMNIQQIDSDAEALATDGQDLIREICSGATRLKKHRNKVQTD
ncbi:MAG: hypothetical protein GY748_25255 [Planctomycetaceae bacterium]|nr:hypothetical protein [Planctomycetaceae bacterium]